jgi:hypothetical protein
VILIFVNAPEQRLSNLYKRISCVKSNNKKYKELERPKHEKFNS